MLQMLEEYELLILGHFDNHLEQVSRHLVANQLLHQNQLPISRKAADQAKKPGDDPIFAGW
jgi:hypothetical protein